MAGQLLSLGTALGVPASSTVSDLRLIIEGKITEGSRDPRNVQVVLPRNMEEPTLSLSDHEGVFLTATLEREAGRQAESEQPHEPLHFLDTVDNQDKELQTIRLERDTLQEKMQSLTQQQAALQE